MEALHGTTILAIRNQNKVCIGGDGQVTFGSTVLKQKAKKIRRLYQNKVLAGFAGATADAFTLFEKFEKKLEQYNGDIARAAVELAKDWRSDKMLRKLEALLIVANEEHLYILSGNGDVIEPDDDVTAIGSGGPYALASARALIKHSKLSMREIVEESLHIASEICIYTNSEICVDELI
ncbi:MAG: ATP-dependent protease subunit HslV [Pseudomonadota bacterium]